MAATVVLLMALALPVRSAEPSPSLTVVTYNLRFASSTGENAWPSRKDAVIECVREMNPDLMGTQEGLYDQLRDLAAGMPEYAWLGQGREGGSHGEFMAIFYRRDRFDAQAYDHFWLSDTPEVIGSTSWGNSIPRMATWVRFLDRASQRQFILLNTHFDHQVQAAREKAAELIAQRIADLKTELPILVTGDFNAVNGHNKAYDILVQPDRLADTWHLAAERRNEDCGTFNGFRSVPRDGRRIDWILVRGAVEVSLAEVVPWRKDDIFPSDHFPVLTRLRWK